MKMKMNECKILFTLSACYGGGGPFKLEVGARSVQCKLN